jgi:ubiquinone/menaquinone biosynthesis C-methylase UbiE
MFNLMPAYITVHPFRRGKPTLQCWPFPAFTQREFEETSVAVKPETKRESFSRKMIDILNFGALNLALAIGYRTGLNDVLDTFDTPQAASSIAEKASLNPRYVSEWLAIMATGGIVEVSVGGDGENRFLLPTAHGDFITRRAGSSNLGVYSQEIPLLTTCAMEAVISGFHTGDGVSYENYPRFQAFMSELADAKHQQVLIDGFLPTVDDGKLIKRLHEGIRVLDLGCAEGLVLLLMAKAFPNSQFMGIDISEEAIRAARKEVQLQELYNVDFVVMDAATLTQNREIRESFDYVMAFDAIHDQIQPLEALRGVHSVLSEGGRFSMVDIAARTNLTGNMTHPMGPFLYTVSLMHCMPVGLVNGGAGLGMMWGQEMAVDMLRQAGFRDVEVQEIPNDPFNLHFFCGK